MVSQDEPIYTAEQVVEKLKTLLPNWEYRDGWIRRQYRTIGWPYTMLVVNTIAHLAEAACHHPDLAVSYAEVHVKLMTHSAKGITNKDFELAQLIEQQVMWRPAEGAALEGFEHGMKKKWTR